MGNNKKLLTEHEKALGPGGQLGVPHLVPQVGQSFIQLQVQGFEFFITMKVLSKQCGRYTQDRSHQNKRKNLFMLFAKFDVKFFFKMPIFE